MSANSAGSMSRGSNVPSTVSKVRAWTPWQDWVNVALGVYLALSPLWVAAAPMEWFITLGVLAVAAGIWASGTASSNIAEGAQIVIGVLLFIAPWLGGFAAAAGTAAWTAWIVGAALVIFSVLAMTMNRTHESDATIPSA